MSVEPITLVEIDIPVCSLTYGTAPCTASVPETGTEKCYNVIRTCQDRPNFTRALKTLRFCRPTPELPYDALPNIDGPPSITPPKLDPGKSMGVRASVKVSFSDHPTSDAMLDRYVADRGYDPFLRGTFWGKFRARIPSLEGVALRVLTGYVGQALEDMHTEHYVVTGSTMDSSGVTITAKDALSFCDGKKAQCPLPSTGRLDSALTGTPSTFTLAPSGIGDDEYGVREDTPGEGAVCLSNKEIIRYTRVGDVCTVVERGAYGSTQQNHDEDAAAQLVKVYDAMSVADILYSLFVDFTPGIDASWVNLPAWELDADTYIGHLYTGVIAAPTEVNTLVNELLQQAGASVWWDPAEQQIRFQSLRPVTPGSAVYDDDQLLADSLAAKEQPSTRLSQHLTYYGLRDYTNKTDKETNFSQQVLTIDPEADADYDGFPAFGKVLSRWIPVGSRAAAQRLNDMLLARFRDPPREIPFSLYNSNGALPVLGQGIFLRPRSFQDTTGLPADVPAIVISRESREDVTEYTAQELKFSDALAPDGDRNVYIDTDQFNLNLRDLYDDQYGSIPEGASITFYVSPGAYIGSHSNSLPAVDVGDWPEGTILLLVIGTEEDDDAGIVGYGGNGGGYPGVFAGEDGGPAIYTRFPIEITNLGLIGGGGGGGEPYVAIGGPDDSQCGGGGAAGFNGYATPSGARRGGIGGLGNPKAGDGTLTIGSDGSSDNGHIGGDGGDLGQGGSGHDGTAETTYTDAGAAIDGVSFVTFTDGDDGNTIGAQIN